jgi:hypothetical protein
MSLHAAGPLVAGALLICTGIFAAAWGRSDARRLISLPVLAAGAMVSVAGVSRFAASPRDAATGQVLAALVAVAGLAASVLGAAWARRGDQR